MIGHFLFALKSAFLEIFQKPPPGDAWYCTQIWFFWVKGLAVLVEPLGDAILWLDLCFSLSFYMSLLVLKIGEKLLRIVCTAWRHGARRQAPYQRYEGCSGSQKTLFFVLFPQQGPPGGSTIPPGATFHFWVLGTTTFFWFAQFL